ncbi:hypothetical protein HMI56_004589 [Coelomomyces lativittatus]|nr:hypothetical protein HMI56_004589 [Coelomomyces lativittatus]
MKDALVKDASCSNKNTDDDVVVTETVNRASALDALQSLQVFITSLPDNSATGTFSKKV